MWMSQRVDAIDLVILLLRIALVALLYLFLLLVLRSAVGGLRRVPSASAPGVVQREALELLVLEPGRSNLSAGQRMRLGDGATLGRAEHADLVLADPAVSAEHARLDRVGRAWVVTDLGSTNGTRLNQTHVRGAAPLADGDVLALGAVRLKVVAR